MPRQECADCGVQTPEFGCKNCGSTKLRPVLASPADAQPRRPLLEATYASRARSLVLSR